MSTIREQIVAAAVTALATGTPMQYVHYRGGPPMMADLVTGRIDFGLMSYIAAKPQIDDKKLKTVLHDLSTGLAGTGDDLGRILDQGNQILATLDEIWPQTDRVITNGGRVLGIVNDNATSLRTLATRSKQFATFLRDYAPEFGNVRVPWMLST